MDRGLAQASALTFFQDGYERFLQANQAELDRIEDVKVAFRTGKIDLIKDIN